MTSVGTVRYKNMKCRHTLGILLFICVAASVPDVSARISALPTSVASTQSADNTTDNSTAQNFSDNVTTIFAPNLTTEVFLTTTALEVDTSALPTSTTNGLENPVIHPKDDAETWKIVAYAMSASTGVLLAAFIVVLICTLRLRTKLKRCSNTLYPITPGEQEANTYLDFDENPNKNSKHSRVELKQMTRREEEEFDSPTMAPTPPPTRRSKEAPPPPPPSSMPKSKSTDDVPAVPTRTANKFQSRKPPEKTTLLEQAKHNSGGSGFDNSAFVTDAADNQHGNVSDDDDDDEMYESYEAQANGENVDMDDVARPYEEPVKTSTSGITEELMRRQSSSSGLPELMYQRNGSLDQYNPLEMADEEGIEFGHLDSDIGVPNMVALQTFDDLRYFEDPERIAEPEENIESKNDGKSNADEVTKSADELNEDMVMYDDADMAVVDDFDGNEEPGLYEDYDPNEIDGSDHRRPSKTSNSEQASDFPAPVVPPRRDLKRGLNFQKSTGKFDNVVMSLIVDESKSPEKLELESDNFNHEQSEQDSTEVHFRPGRVSEYESRQKRESYFLFKDDHTSILTDPSSVSGTESQMLGVGDRRDSTDEFEILEAVANGDVPNLKDNELLKLHQETLNVESQLLAQLTPSDDEDEWSDKEQGEGQLYDVPPPSHLPPSNPSPDTITTDQ